LSFRPSGEKRKKRKEEKGRKEREGGEAKGPAGGTVFCGVDSEMQILAETGFFMRIVSLRKKEERKKREARAGQGEESNAAKTCPAGRIVLARNYRGKKKKKKKKKEKKKKKKRGKQVIGNAARATRILRHCRYSGHTRGSYDLKGEKKKKKEGKRRREEMFGRGEIGVDQKGRPIAVPSPRKGKRRRG